MNRRPYRAAWAEEDWPPFPHLPLLYNPPPAAVVCHEAAATLHIQFNDLCERIMELEAQLEDMGKELARMKRGLHTHQKAAQKPKDAAQGQAKAKAAPKTGDVDELRRITHQ